MAKIRTLALAASVLALCACSSGSDSTLERETATDQLTIFAAVSLTESFEELAGIFMRDNPGITVRAVYDGSSTLATQLIEGAEADIFASADRATMDAVVDAGVITGSIEVFATNTLQIAVAPGNPLNIHTLADLAIDRNAVVLCAHQVPCGAAAAMLLERAGVTLTPVSEEQNVRAVLTKVSGGEADAGLVWATDVAAVGTVTGVPISGAEKAATSYLIGVPFASESRSLASQFSKLVLSNRGQQVLLSHGFGIQ